MPKYTLQFLLLWCASCFILPSAMGQVTAGFTASDTAVCAPQVVSFSNASTGATSYSWNFDNGTPSSVLMDASTPFTVPGTYTVTLTAYNGSDSSTYSVVIRVYSIPTVSFTATSATSGCPGTPVSFTNSSTPGSWGALTYTWSFGDGGSSTLGSPTYTYDYSGNFNVTLYATNVKGCINSTSIADEVHIFTPAAIAFTAPTQYCRPPATVPFTNTTTGTAPLSYTWKYGDGLSGTGTSSTHTYTASGSYTVSLKATDGNGCKDSLSKPAYVVVGTQTASFTASPTTVCIGPPVAFTNTSLSYISSNWSFGDGATSTVMSPTHGYTAAGTYTVRLISYNGGVCYDTTTQTITVLPSPTGSITQSPAEPCGPLNPRASPVPVTYAASIPAGCTVSWIFSDNHVLPTTASGTPVVHSFSVSEVYKIDMIIDNSIGCKDTVVKMDTVYNLIWGVGSSAVSGCAPLSMSFYGNASSVVGDWFLPVPPDSLYVTYPYPITSYNWTFGDGSPNSTLAAPSHTYTAIGSYTFTPTCAITTANGCGATAPFTITEGVTPVASFTMSPTHVCTGAIATFGCTSTSLIDEYYWNFGTGGLGFDYLNGPEYRTVAHVDSVPGIHTVRLGVFNNGCESAEVTLMDTVEYPNAEINYAFECNPVDGILFTDVSLGDSSRMWLFGDGTTSTISDPVHVFPASTTYAVELATYNSTNGCRDTSTVDIDLVRPTVSFTVYPGDTLNVCPASTVTFLSTVIGSYPVLGYKWYDNGTLFDSVDANGIGTFDSRGLQTISLVITDDRSCLDTFTRANYVNVAQPIVNYSISPPFGCAPLPVLFTDLSTDVAGAPLKKYAWSFGDGTTSSLTAPTASVSHTYTASGVYTVKEIVTDTFQCKDSLTTGTLSVNKPVAQFTVANNVCTYANVPFNNTSTGYTSVLWTFGDGATSTVVSPVHVYTAAGVYTARLVVYSSLSCSDTATLVSYITADASPVASFHMNDSFAICPPLNVSFTNTSTGATSYYWNLGDSTFSYLASPGDIYIYPAVYTVQEVAINSAGCTDTATGHVSVFGYPGAFSYTPTSGCSPLSVHFTAVLTGVSSVIWDFDDGTSSVSGSDTISHTYAAAGPYIPRLILTDTTGCTSYSTGADTIKADAVAASFTATPSPACQGVPVTFSNTSTSYFSTIATQSWVFASGSGSGLADPAHTFTISGTFPVTLSVADAKGCSGTVTENVAISAPPPAITGALSLCAGAADTLSDAGGGTWSISSAAVATIGAATGIVSGIAHGTATVTYTSASGCSVQTTVTVNPLPGGPVTGASSICAGTTAIFSDVTTGGIWSSSNAAVATVNSSTGVVTGVSSGAVVISYSLGGGCPVTKMLTVAGSPTLISGPTTVCTGSAVLETDGITGGTWSSSNTAAATAGSATGWVTGAGTGTAIITYSLGIGCIATQIVSVNAAPEGITGGMSVCVGAAALLSDATSGGAWVSETTGIATVTRTGIVTGASAGVDTITYTGGGCSVSAVVTVDLTPSVPTVTGAGTGRICGGDSITLSDLVTGGVWSSSSTAVASVDAAGNVSGITSGTATITYSLGGVCAATKVVTVNPMAALTGGTGVCVGATTDLTDGVTGGTWSSGAALIASVNGTGVVTGEATGTSAITYTTAAGCVATVVVTVNLTPSPISGILHVCADATTALGNTAGGGIWTSSNTAVAIPIPVGSSAGVISGVAPGTASVTYSLGSGCVVSAIVTVNALPAAISGVAVCSGMSATLSETSTGGAWSSAAPAVASVIAAGVVTGGAPDTTTVSYALPDGCAVTAVVTVNPLPVPISGLFRVCVGSSTMLSGSTGGGWISSNTGVATIDGSGTVTGASAGTAVIIYALPSGCSTSVIMTVNAAPAAISGSSTICVGALLPFTDPTAGGIWSSSNTLVAPVDASGGVSGAGTGIATISYTVLGCPATLPVTVNMPPTPFAIPVLCAGSSEALTGSPGGGTWSSGNTAVATVNEEGGTIYGIIGGTASITYSLGVGCTAAATVIVEALPAAITGTSDVCLGYSTLLGDPSGGGVWSSTDTTVARITTLGEVSGVAGGLATISYTSLTTGCAATRLVTVVVVPAITGVSNMCAYSTVMSVADAITGGTWTSTSATVSSVGLVTPYAAGSATVTYTIPLGCYTAATFTVNPVPDPITGTDRFCHGLTTTLSEITTGGAWSSSNTLAAPIVPVTSASITVSGLSAGTAVISYVLPVTGCMQTDTVTIDSFPVAGAITGLAVVCVDAVDSLSDMAAGGVWSSSNGSATVSGGAVSGVSAGIDTIKYDVINTCGSAATTKTMTVNPLPGAGSITGASSVCVGDSVLLADVVTGGIWSSGAVAAVVPVAAGSWVLGISAGADTIRYAVINSCGVAIAAQPVTVNTLPDPGTISGADSLCISATLTLTDIVTGGVWSGSNSTINIAGAGSIVAESVGVDTITYSVTGVCGTASATLVITVNALTVAGVINGFDSVCEGETDTLTGTPPGGTWSVSNSSAVVAGGVVSGISVGADTIVYSITGECGVAAASYPIAVLPVSNCDTRTPSGPANGGKVLRVWPNPNDGMFTVLLSSAIDEPVQIIITNVVGEKVKVLTMVTNKETDILLNTAAGVYFITASTGEGSYVVKVVVSP